MASDELSRVEDYERLLADTLGGWSPQRRTVLAAAMAERWLAAYEAFSTAEQWGDAAVLRGGLDAVWGHVLGRSLTKAQSARLRDRLHDVTPHMDDFDADEALAACVMVLDALKCCDGPDNEWPATEALFTGFDAVAPSWFIAPETQPRLWKQAGVRKELRKQLWLLGRVGAIERFDEAAVEALRRELTAADARGEPRRRRAPTGPTLVSNQALFDQYRRMLEADLRDEPWRPDPDEGPYMFGTALLSAWMARYSRRRQTIDGSYGKPADTAAEAALVARQRTLDAAETGAPNWEPDVREVVEMAMQNPDVGFDVRSPDAPHGYGPSLRRLWVAAKRGGASDRDALEQVIAWGRHRPPAWDTLDRMKRKKDAAQAQAAAALAEKLARDVTWTETDDVFHPWEAEVDGQRWQARLNDFPDEVMYTLLVDCVAIGDFNDWPKRWVW